MLKDVDLVISVYDGGVDMSILYNGTLYTRDDWQEDKLSHTMGLAFKYIYDYESIEFVLDVCFPKFHKALICIDGCIEFIQNKKEV